VSYEQNLPIARYVYSGLGTVDAWVSRYFEQPIRGIHASVDNQIAYGNVQEIAVLFHMRVDPNDIRADLPVYNFLCLAAEQVRVYVLKYDQNLFKIFMVEYSANSRTYDCRIKIGQPKAEILGNLPHPNMRSGTTLIYLDREVKGEELFRQLNIYFDGTGRVAKVQLIAWDFI
jgi:hypothetical protein